MKNKILHVRVTEEQYNQLAELSKIRKQTLSELIRVIIWLFTDKFEK